MIPAASTSSSKTPDTEIHDPAPRLESKGLFKSLKGLFVSKKPSQQVETSSFPDDRRISSENQLVQAPAKKTQAEYRKSLDLTAVNQKLKDHSTAISLPNSSAIAIPLTTRSEGSAGSSPLSLSPKGSSTLIPDSPSSSLSRTSLSSTSPKGLPSPKLLANQWENLSKNLVQIHTLLNQKVEMTSALKRLSKSQYLIFDNQTLQWVEGSKYALSSKRADGIKHIFRSIHRAFLFDQYEFTLEQRPGEAPQRAEIMQLAYTLLDNPGTREIIYKEEELHNLWITLLLTERFQRFLQESNRIQIMICKTQASRSLLIETLASQGTSFDELSVFKEFFKRCDLMLGRYTEFVISLREKDPKGRYKVLEYYIETAKLSRSPREMEDPFAFTGEMQETARSKFFERAYIACVKLLSEKGQLYFEQCVRQFQPLCIQLISRALISLKTRGCQANLESHQATLEKLNPKSWEEIGMLFNLIGEDLLHLPAPVRDV